jgi:uncharacterized protein (DUF885 family)
MAATALQLNYNRSIPAANAANEQIAASSLVSAGATDPKAQAAFDRLVDEYFDACFKFDPDWATEAGIHKYDDKLVDLSHPVIAARVSELKNFVRRLEAIDPTKLNAVSQVDLKMLTADANGTLLTLDSIKKWQKDPDHYSSALSSNVFSLMKRSFSTPEERLRCVIAREKAGKKLLASGRENLQKTPRIFTQIALEQLPGTISFFETAVPQAFIQVKDAKLQAEFAATNAATINELKSYQTYVKDHLLPSSVDEFAIGKDNYQKKLAYDEMVDEPLDSLLSKGYDELHRLQREFTETAHKIDPNKSPTEVYATISAEHPKPDQLLKAVHDVLADLRTKSLAVVDIPTEDELKVQETPPFMRATTFASMDAPGAFETQAKEAYYQVTLPEKDWSAKRTEQHMRFFCTGDLINTSVHEAYPGHFVQGLWVKQAPSKTRKLLGPASYVEGWAHYCEQMMMEQHPDDLQMKLVQVHDALLRAARYIVGISMHTKGMTIAQATDFFVKEGYQEPANGEREAKRGAGDPTYLVYTLGKLQILKLRDDYKAMKGDKFNLKQFHDEFLAQGNVPISLMRTIMLGQ